MFDWMTWSVEAVGIAILLLWIIMPIREFTSIFRHLLRRPAPDRAAAFREPTDRSVAP